MISTIDVVTLAHTDEWLLELQMVDGQNVLQKKVHRKNKRKIAQLHYELELSKQLKMQMILRPLAIEQQEQFVYMTYETSEHYITVAELCRRPQSIYQFLKIALALTNFFIELHQASYVYHNLHPQHILVHPETFEVKVFNFEYAFKQSEYEHTFEEEEPLALHRLHYLAPEESGRINSTVDVQSELYSLGVLFYEMLTASMPYEGEGAAYLHKMLTTEPKSFEVAGVDVPDILQKIVLKLLCKNKTERYKSAIGLKEDLAVCWHNVSNQQALTDFPLATHDEYGKKQLLPIIPARAETIDTLLKAITQKQSEAYVLCGPKGSGKSHIVSTVAQQLLLESYQVLCFVPASRQTLMKNPPLFTVFRQYFKHLLQGSDDELDSYRTQLAKLTTILPKLLLNDLPELTFFEDVLRFNEDIYMIEQEALFHVLAEMLTLLAIERALVIMVDDCSELDEVSRTFLQYLRAKEIPYYVLLADEAEHLDVVELLLNGMKYQTVTTGLLGEKEIYDWLQQSLKKDEPTLEQCASLLKDVTNGHPLFVQQVFDELCQLQVLKFNATQNNWNFDLSLLDMNAIATYEHFTKKALANLSEQQLILLQFASCLGAKFQVELLLEAVPIDKQEAQQAFLALVQKRILIANPEQLALLETYIYHQMLDEIAITASFFNEDMYLAVAALVDVAGRIHQQIFSFLLQLPNKNKHKRLLVHHMQQCIDLLTIEQLHYYIVFNFELGDASTKSGLFYEGLQFAQQAFNYVPQSYWHEHYELMLEIYIMYANALFLNNRLHEANAIFDRVIAEAKSDHERLYVYNEKILFITFKQTEQYSEVEIEEILSLATAALKLMDITLPKNVTQLDVLKEFMLLKMKLNRNSLNQLRALKDMDDANMQLVLKLLMNICGATLLKSELLYVWVVIRAIRLILKHGNVEFASVFYGSFATILGTAFKDFELGYQFGLLSIEHVEKHDNVLYKGNVYANFGVSVSYFKEPYEKSMDATLKTQVYSINNSLHHLYNAMAASYILNYMHLAGTDLPLIKTEFEEQRKFLLGSTNDISLIFVMELMQWISVLQHEKEADWEFPVQAKSRVSHWEGHLTLRLQMSYLLCDVERGFKFIDLLEEFIPDSNIRPERPQYYFYKALTLFRIMRQQTKKNEYFNYLQEVRNCMKILRKFAKLNPHNFEHLLMLVEALYFQYTDKKRKAALYFDRSIQLAKIAGNLRDEAIAAINAALFYDACDDSHKAGDYMQRAITLLYTWHAPKVAEVWVNHFGHLLKQELVAQAPKQESFNIEPVVNMYQKIARESNSNALLQASIEEMLLHLDAEQLYLFKVEDNVFTLLAEVDSVNQMFYFNNLSPGKLPPKILPKLLSEALETRRYVLHINAISNDQSIMSLPIFNKGEIAAIIYCTNSRIASIFTQSKIDLVTILATQLLVALENIERQQLLEQEVAKRTQEIVAVNEQLHVMNARLRQNEQERKYLLQHISHDLRSPITSVLGYVEALQSGIVKSEEQQMKYLERSKIRLLGLNHLIQDLFDMTMLEVGRVEYNKQFIALADLYVLISYTIEQELDGLPLTFVTKITGEQENEYVMMDEDRILQVIHNFTSNIQKYANTGVVTLEFNILSDKVEIIIQDEGIGIPKKDLPFIFDMHYIASNNDKKEAYGIGLAICKRIIEHHQGNLTIHSEEQKGTMILLTLPTTQLY